MNTFDNNTNSWVEHLPLKNKSYSGAENCSFLIQNENIYIMDNHRAALWCWQHALNQKINSSEINQYNFFHLDAHEDAKMDVSSELWNRIQGASLNDYLEMKSNLGNYFLFRWDNYLPVFIHENQKAIRKSVFATHGVGLKGHAHQRLNSYELMKEFPKLFVDELQWICNIDLDYFFAKDYKKVSLFHQEWIMDFFKCLKVHYDQGDIAFMTVALSPECCGEWSQSEKILSLFDDVFNLGLKDFKGLIEPKNRS